MAPRKRFNPVEFYRKAASTKPLSVKAPKTRHTPATTPQLSTIGHLFDKAAGPLADYIKGEREEKRSAAERADQATTVEMIKALTAPQTAYDQETPYGADLVIKRHEAGDYNIKDTRNWWGKFIGEDKPEGMGPGARGLMTQILLGDKEKRDAAELLSGERAYKKEVAEALAASKLAAARAKPGTDPTRYKEWKLSGSKLSFEKWMEKDDLQKIGLRPAGSGEQPTAIPGGPADLKQQRVKLQETSNKLMSRRVTLLEQQGDPKYIREIERIRKSEGYLIDLKKSRPKAEGALKTLEMKAAQVQSVIKEALPLARSMWSAGFGTVFKGVPESSSRKLAGLLINLRAIIGFDTLAEMRANSPTGGALGQVSNIEINLLQAVKGTLDQGQREILVRSLEHISKNYPQLVELARTRFRKQYAPLEKQPGSNPKVIRLDAKGNVIP